VTTSLERSVQPRAAAPKRAKAARGRRRLLSALALAAVALVALAPIALLIESTFTTNQPGQASQYSLFNWTHAFSDPAMISAIRNTIELSAVRVALTLVIALPIAWLIARTNIVGRRVAENLAWLSIFLPSLPLTLGWIILLNPTNGIGNEILRHLPGLGGSHGPLGIYGFWGITWVHLSATAVPYMIVLTLPAFRRMDPSLEDAARMAGSSRLRAAITITGPLLRPAILAATIIGFIYSLQAFEVELLLGTPVGLNVYSTQIYSYLTQAVPQYGQATVLGSTFLVGLVIMAYFYRRSVTSRDYTTVSGKLFNDSPIQLRTTTRAVLSTLVGLWFLVAAVLPLAFMVLGSFMNQYGFFNIPHPFTAAHWSTVLSSPSFTSGFWNSIEIGLLSAVIGVVAYFCIAWIVVRSRLYGRAAIDIMAWLPIAVPGLLLGLGLLWLYLDVVVFQSVLYGTVLGLAVALVVDHMAIGTQQIKVGLMQVTSELEASARIAGAGRLRSSAGITAPLISPWLAGVAILVFGSAIRNISSVILLASPTSQPLSLLLLQYSTSGQLEAGSAIGVITTAMTLAFALVARALTRTRMSQ